ncbi:Glutathione S-transferase [Phytophthora cinnamomi]|uniref:Glutathione S-transferase n=1 Tax=Phytophthora cinnamomi TaxID=4785 RepID=UPI00355AC0BA|nr:Glutathione S-transferase [Phytophthora cinnamomi]
MPTLRTSPIDYFNVLTECRPFRICRDRTHTIMSATPSLKLIYWAIPARATLARLMFHYGNVSFEDETVGQGSADFLALKPTLPLGQVPVLEVDGVLYAQSIAIARYAARLVGLHPADTTDALFVDMITDTFMELNGPLYGTCFCLDAAAKCEKIGAFLSASAPKYFSMLEKTVRGKFFLGDKFSIADFLLFDAVAYLVKPNMPPFDLSVY